jgi:hypothetical protein
MRGVTWDLVWEKRCGGKKHDGEGVNSILRLRRGEAVEGGQVASYTMLQRDGGGGPRLDR